MSAEPGVVTLALEAALTTDGCEDAEVEVLLKRASGLSLRVARGSRPEEGAFVEEAVAVHVVLPDGRSAVASAPSWTDVACCGRRAARHALLRPEPHDPDLLATWRRRGPRGRASSSAAPRRVAPRPADLSGALAEVERAALGVDERVTALDTGLLRAARVTTYLAATDGTACHQEHDAVQAHVAIVARDGLRVVSHAEGWAGPTLAAEAAGRLGQHAGSGALLHLVGVAGAAPVGRLLLAPAAACEVLFAAAPALLGLGVRASTAVPVAFPEALFLVEDAADDAEARRVAVDGAGLVLAPVLVVGDGTWRPPASGHLPWVRAGVSDLATPGWLRLTCGMRGAGVPEEELATRLAPGLHALSVRTLDVDSATLRWSGLVAGYWMEAGRRRHAVARLPLTLELPRVLASLLAAGDEALAVHASGTVRAPALLFDTVPLR